MPSAHTSRFAAVAFIFGGHSQLSPQKAIDNLRM